MLTRMIDGKKVVLSSDEEMIVRAEWEANMTSTIKKLAIAELERKRFLALDALQTKTLESAMFDPNTPQAVKDYSIALNESK